MLALALMFWCAGTGCMIVSYARAEMDPTTTQSAERITSSSAAMDAHACCKARHKSSKSSVSTARRTTSHSENSKLNLITLPAVPVPSSAMSCCPLTSGSIIAASRSQSSDDHLSLDENSSDSFGVTNSSSTPLAIPLRLPNRAHSYLLDCAFLI